MATAVLTDEIAGEVAASLSLSASTWPRRRKWQMIPAIAPLQGSAGHSSRAHYHGQISEAVAHIILLLPAAKPPLGRCAETRDRAGDLQIFSLAAQVTAPRHFITARIWRHWTVPFPFAGGHAPHGIIVLCRDPGSNRGPSDLRSDALPAELSRQLSWFWEQLGLR